jgi:hypothetical protein
MNDNDYRKVFQAEQWKDENTDPGGGRLISVLGARFDHHSDTARKLEERRQSGQKKIILVVL